MSPTSKNYKSEVSIDSKLYFAYRKRCFFVDLFVRISNAVAITMYSNIGYIVYRTVLEYYSGDENAFDMRKALKRDTEKRSMIPIQNPVRPEDID